MKSKQDGEREWNKARERAEERKQLRRVATLTVDQAHKRRCIEHLVGLFNAWDNNTLSLCQKW